LELNPHDFNDETLRSMLKQAFPGPGPQLETDLWPRMLLRIEEHGIHVHWLDWALLAGVGLALVLLLPQLIPQVVYQL
jgi:hypothetical protein